MGIMNDIVNMLDSNREQIETDESKKSKIEIIIANGKQHLRDYNPLLTEEDFEKPTRARSLLFDYCRYDYSNAVEMFDHNFENEILKLRQEYEVRMYDTEE
nr:hypothetical protein [uncultured Ruminococcus sp.]